MDNNSSCWTCFSISSETYGIGTAVFKILIPPRRDKVTDF